MADEETTAPTDEVDVTTREQQLPSLELPEYHGRAPVGMKTSLNGAGNRVTREHSIGDRVVLVIEAKVKKAGHEETDDGLIYAEVLKVTDLFEIQGDPGRRLISAVRQSYRTADDEANGRAPLSEEFGAAGVTDASGVALTPSELDELRGDPVRAMLDEQTTPVVIVYSDGARELWPDDFEPNTTRPAAGERFETEDGDDVYVEKVLHAETGETVEEWTREQEEERLLELEKRLEAEELAEEEGEDVDDLEDLAPEGAEDYDGPVDEFEVGDSDPGAPPIDHDLEPLEPELPGEEIPDNVTPIGNAASELAEELHEPTDADFDLIDQGVPEVVAVVEQIHDVPILERLLEAERRGRRRPGGKNLKTRSGVTDALVSRIDLLKNDGEG